jgi:hypothetical protein
LPKGGKRFENCRNVRDAGAGEGARDRSGRDRRVNLHQVVAHGTDALRERGRPGQPADASWLWLFLLHFYA